MNKFERVSRHPEAVDRLRIVAAAFAVLVLLQAILAGQFLNSTENLRSVHRVVGEAMGFVALGVVWSALAMRRASAWHWRGSVALILLTSAQTGLGFAGRDVPAAAALHIPLGVVLFGLGVALAVVPGPSRTGHPADRPAQATSTKRL